MNDAFLIDEDTTTPADETLTIRLGRPGDARAIERLSELDAGEPGAEPHLVADEDGEIVATLSLADGAELGNPFRRTANAAALLRLRASQIRTGHAGRRGTRRVARLVQVASSILALAVLTGVMATAAVASPAAAKPGFLPGSWKVVGTISGSSVDGPMSTVFSGSVRMALKVSKDFSVGGDGTWAMTMVGKGPVASTMNGNAAVKVTGMATDIRFAGQQTVTGTVTDGVRSTPIRMNRPFAGRLVIKRAGKCRVTGTSPMGGGAMLTWTALLSGSGTCNA